MHSFQTSTADTTTVFDAANGSAVDGYRWLGSPSSILDLGFYTWAPSYTRSMDETISSIHVKNGYKMTICKDASFAQTDDCMTFNPNTTIGGPC